MRQQMLTPAEYRLELAGQMSEDVLLRRATEMARELGWLTYHTHDSRLSEPGFLDLVLVHAVQRRTLFRELKRQRVRKPTREQQEWIRQLDAAGQDAAVWRPLDLLEERVLFELRMSSRPQDHRLAWISTPPPFGVLTCDCGRIATDDADHSTHLASLPARSLT